MVSIMCIFNSVTVILFHGLIIVFHSSLYVWCNGESLIKTFFWSSLLAAGFDGKHVYNLHVFLNGALQAQRGIVFVYNL